MTPNVGEQSGEMPIGDTQRDGTVVRRVVCARCVSSGEMPLKQARKKEGKKEGRKEGRKEGKETKRRSKRERERDVEKGWRGKKGARGEEG